MFDFDVAVVIPMGGYSDRFPSSCPKQYFKILGKPLFMFCLEEFYKLEYIKKICLVADNVVYVENVVQEYFQDSEKIIVVSGDSTRHMSIKNGLVKLSKCCNCKVVVVHDGARPIVPKHLLEQVILEASIQGAAGATRPLVSTVIKPCPTDDCLETSLERHLFALSETPQAFLFHLIAHAYEQCTQEELEKGTECLQLVLKYCFIRAKLIAGPDTLWKVTDKKDFYSVVPYMTERSTDVCLLGEEQTDVIQGLMTSLKDRVRMVQTFVDDKEMISSKEKFTTVICFHKYSASADNTLAMCDFRAAINVNSQGLIVHVMTHKTAENVQSKSVSDILAHGTNLKNYYHDNLKKGVVIIHYLTCGQEERLVDLIISLIFIDAQTISGQTLFL